MNRNGYGKLFGRKIGKRPCVGHPLCLHLHVDFFEGVGGVAGCSDSGTFRLPVDYRKSPEQMIAAGRYDRKNDCLLPKSFSVEGEGAVEFEARYFWFKRNFLSEEAVNVIKREDMARPWMPAKFEHTLAHGAIFPEKQRQFPIVGLGSVIEIVGSLFSPYLTKLGAERCFYVFPFDGFWSQYCAALAVRRLFV